VFDQSKRSKVRKVNVNSTPENKTRKQKFRRPSVFSSTNRFFRDKAEIVLRVVFLSSFATFSADSPLCLVGLFTRVSGSAKMRKPVSAMSNKKVRKAGAA